MGDTGSLVVGFILAFLAVHLTQQPAGLAVKPVVPLIVLGVPIIDTLWVMARRIGLRLSPFAADRTHVHHKFLDLGFDHRYTVIVIYGLSLFWSFFAVLAHTWPDALLLCCFLFGSALFYGGLRYMVSHPHIYQRLVLDSSQGLRNSRVYLKVADLADNLAAFAVIPLLGFLCLTVLAGGHFPLYLWQILGTLLLMTVVLLVLLRDLGLHYLFFLVYLAVLGLTYAIDHFASQATLLGWPLGQWNSTAVWTVAVIVGFKILFRKDGDFFVSSVDILVLGISIFLAAFFYHVHPMPDIALPLVQSFVLYLGLRVSVNRDAIHGRLATCGMLTTMVTLTLRGFF